MSRRISRRTLLRGAGAAVSLPWLESVASATSAGQLPEPPLRAVFLFMPNGVRPDYWTPPGDGEDFELILAAPPASARRILADQPLAVPVACIGEFLAEGGLWQELDGRRTPLAPSGWEHRLE